ncbi:MAG: MBL fold metallo-hydrolase [Thaumarchaeota archaeon]|nr:MBL fold metallo-hydrolase [Nitrososphaerota archaeon]
MIEYQGLEISWLGHDSFKLKKVITLIIDPYKISSKEEADIVLITHEHFDHLSREDLKKVVGPQTIAISMQKCSQELSILGLAEVKIVKAGDILEVKGVTIEAVESYNINKFKEPGLVFHPREDGNLGFVIDFGGVRVYHSGDTDDIPEMADIKADIALLPVSGTYVMTPDEATKAVMKLEPKLAIPMHYGTIVGSEMDAQRFKDLAPCDVQILERE